MNEKSYVSQEQHVCLVCGVAFDTGSLLLDKRLRASMRRHTVTTWGLCVEHQRSFDEGYVALVECDPERSGSPSTGELMKPEQAYRTGRLAHVKREAFAKLFKMQLRADQACVFVEAEVIDWLQQVAETRTN